MRRIILPLVLACGLAGYVVYRQRGQADVATVQELERDATAAMAALNQANTELLTWLPTSISALVTPLVTDPPAAGRAIGADLLPRLDAYLVVADRAVTAAAAYLERQPDPSITPMLDSIRRRTAALHQLRASLATTRDDLLRPGLTSADLEAIAARLSGAAMTLTLAN